MSTQPAGLPQKEKWGSKFGVVLAVAGSAVGLGNFLRFPGQAVNNGGGAFMIPYILSFVLVGIPIAWCEWTLGRLGGRFGQNNAPGIMYAIWRRGPAKGLGALALLIPVTIYMYYILLEAWCLDYCIWFVQGGFARLFADATQGVTGHAAEVAAVVGQTKDHFRENCGLLRHGAYLTGGRMIWLVLISFLVNFFIIYQGVTRGIEKFCKWAMPLLIFCALVILARVLTLPGISSGLGFMWNPDWQALKNPQVWLAAAGQIFFSLSVGFGLILCYASYLRENDDVVLTSLSASSTNEFCEVILGGMIVVPTAFLFLGAENATGGEYGTFGIGFVTVPAIMHFMPGGPFWGSLFGALWFGLLFLAAVTSSLSMLQPAVAFIEDGFGLKRRASVALLGVITAIGAALTMYFSKNLLAMDHADFWCNLGMIIAATALVIIFGWVVGAERGVREMNRGADFAVPRFMPFMIRYVTPTFLLVILGFWTYTTLPSYWSAMDPAKQGPRAAEAKVREALSLGDSLAALLTGPGGSAERLAQEVYETVAAVTEPGPFEELAAWTGELQATIRSGTDDADASEGLVAAAVAERFGLPPLGEQREAIVDGLLAVKALTPGELAAKIQRLAGAYADRLRPERTAAFIAAVRVRAAAASESAMADANVARLVFLGILVFYIVLVVLSDIACRNRIGRAIAAAERQGLDWEAAR